MIFPCSDFRHAVMTPAILLMCEYLMRCPLTSGRDIAIGSFLCSIVLAVSIIIYDSYIVLFSRLEMNFSWRLNFTFSSI